jgi:hypothetical protein
MAGLCFEEDESVERNGGRGALGCGNIWVSDLVSRMARESAPRGGDLGKIEQF